MRKEASAKTLNTVSILLIVLIVLDIALGINAYSKTVPVDGICYPANIQGLEDLNCIGLNYVWNIIHLIMTIILLVLNWRFKLPKWLKVILLIMLVLLIKPFFTLVFISMIIQLFVYAIRA